MPRTPTSQTSVSGRCVTHLCSSLNSRRYNCPHFIKLHRLISYYYLSVQLGQKNGFGCYDCSIPYSLGGRGHLVTRHKPGGQTPLLSLEYPHSSHKHCVSLASILPLISNRRYEQSTSKDSEEGRPQTEETSWISFTLDDFRIPDAAYRCGIAIRCL